MRLYLLRTGVILVTFIVAFLVTTIVSDSVDKHTGYYDEGLRDSATFNQLWRIR